MYNHNKAQQSKNRVHISWDILYAIDLRREKLLNATIDIIGLDYSNSSA